MSFLKKWMLVIAMVTGAALYLTYRAATPLHQYGAVLLSCCKHLQPILLSIMLFLTFSKIEPGQMKPHRWEWWLLLVQGGTFCITALLLIIFKDSGFKIGLECFMICMICPTATACAVVTEKLGGDTAGVLTYTILINLLTAILVPMFIPLVFPAGNTDFISSFHRIIAKVFPILIMPCLAAWMVRYLFPELHSRIINYTHLSFYIWAISLCIAILMSTRALIQYDGSKTVLFEIFAASLLSCIIQFRLGKKIGAHYDKKIENKFVTHREITAGQALGQKNTVFGIWMGYTFLDPVTSLACGFYSIWHNCFNTWQLSKIKQGK